MTYVKPAENTVALPKKPSRLIRVALQALKEVEADARYQVDMGTWHSKEAGKLCSVCLAGSVMAKVLKTNPRRNSLPSHFNHTKGKFTKMRLEALDFFRKGRMNAGLEYCGVSKKRRDEVKAEGSAFSWRYDQHSLNGRKVKIPSYRHDHSGFHQCMNVLAASLEKLGL